MRAFCYASGLIAFGDDVPDGALLIGEGPAAQLRDYIETQARHGYDTITVRGRLQKKPGTDCLLVPGVPETAGESQKLDKLHAWLWWIGAHAPKRLTIHEPRRPPLTRPQKEALIAARDKGGAAFASHGIRSRAGGAHRRMCLHLAAVGLVKNAPPWPITPAGLKQLAT